MGEEETKEPPITHTLAELRNFVDCLVKDNRIILIEDPDHNDGRFYTFLETQLKCLEANTAKHICVEAGHDYNSRFKKFKKTGKTSYLDPFGEYSTEFGAARSRAIRNLVVATEETGITIHATDAADKDESAESLAASKYLDDYDKAHPELNGKPPRGNKEYTKAQSVEHKYRMKENPRIADRIASIAEAYHTEKIVVIIGRGHVRGGSLDLKKLLQNHPKLRGQKIVQIGTDKSVPKNDLAF